MPRKARRLGESRTYHIMIRGNEQRNIFLDDQDRQKFIDILYCKSRDNNFRVYAYCLMDNHVHLLINENNDAIARIMKRINVSYAFYFNNKYQRVGHLFQDRFRSEVIDNDRYLLAAIRYIHNNPLKARMTLQPWDYPWSSCRAYVDLNNEQESFIDNFFILNMFADDLERARQLFLEFSAKEGEETFIDCADYNKGLKEIKDKQEALQFITEYLQKSDSNVWGNKMARNNLIRELKEKSSLSVRAIAEILEIDRNIVQRVK